MRIIRIEKCAECPFVNASRNNVLESTCWMEIRAQATPLHMIIEPWTIPNWCPLEKANDDE